MIHPQSALEEIQIGERRTLFRLFGIPWTVSSQSWQFVTSRFFGGVIVALLALPNLTIVERLTAGLVYGLIVGATNILHILGHTFSGLWIGHPMDENYITRYSILTAYHESEDAVSSDVHLVRALGGPITNITAGLMLGVILFLLPGHYLRFAAILNLLMGLFLLLPVPDADGQVIWRELRRRMQGT